MSTAPHRPFGLLAAREATLKAACREEFQRDADAREASARAHHLESAGGEATEILRSAEAAHERVSHPDPSIREAALYFLAKHWKQAHQYPEHVARILRDDPKPRIRQAAAMCLGEIYSATEDRVVARLLAEVVSDDAEPISVRDSAYFALHGVMRLNPFRYPLDLKIPEQLDWTLIRACLRGESYPARPQDRPILEQVELLGTTSFREAMRHFRQGDEAFDSGDYLKAICEYSEGLAEAPEAPGVLCMRGCAHGNLGNLDEAVADFTAAIELKSDEPIYYLERSEAYRRRGLLDLAEADEQAARRLEEASKGN